jgi:hypothetical protein
LSISACGADVYEDVGVSGREINATVFVTEKCEFLLKFRKSTIT